MSSDPNPHSLPAHLQPFVRSGGRSEVPSVHIRAASDVQVADLSWLARLGFELHVHSAGTDPVDLNALSGALHEFTRIFLTGEVEHSYDGWEVLESCTQLEVLQIAVAGGGPSTALDLAGLVNLKDASIRWPSVLSILDAPRLERLNLLVRVPKGVVAVGPIRYLNAQSPSIVDIAFLRQPEVLETLQFVGGKSVNADGLQRCAALSRLSFLRNREIRGIDSLIKLPLLAELTIIGAREIPDYESLLDLPLARLSVSENYVFDDEFRAVANAREGWSVEPIQRTTSRTDNAGEADRAAFYSVIDKARAASRNSTADPKELKRNLRRLDDVEVQAFANRLQEELKLLNDSQLNIEAAEHFDGMSDDGFLDFRAYLIGRGRETVDVALRDRKKLFNEITTDAPFNEMLLYAASEILHERGVE